MKYLFYIMLTGLVGFTLWSCKEDDFGPILHLNNAPAITAPTAGASFTLVEADAAQLLPVFSWTAADFGFDAGTTYTLQVDVAGNNFAEPATLDVVNDLETSTISQGDLNNILLGKELEGGVPVNLELRVVASVNSEVESLTSAPVAITVTPFATTIVYDQLQVPGNYQAWNPADNNTIIYSAKNDGKYEGYLYFPPATEFKYTKGLSWDTNWGDDGANGTLDPNGANLTAANEGMYRLQVDLNALTHSYAIANWGVIGSATPGGWDTDTDFVYDAGTGLYSVTLDLTAGGEIKFRANDAWDLNYGDDGNNKSLELGGANIPIAESGNYTIDLLIVRQPKFRYQITKN